MPMARLSYKTTPKGTYLVRTQESFLGTYTSLNLASGLLNKGTWVPVGDGDVPVLATSSGNFPLVREDLSKGGILFSVDLSEKV